jgi:hypothetical protein
MQILQKVNFVNLYLHEVYAVNTNTTLILFSIKVSVHLREYVISQNNWYRSTENHMSIKEVPLHDVVVDVWCAMTANRITGPVFFLLRSQIQTHMLHTVWHHLRTPGPSTKKTLCSARHCNSSYCKFYALFINCFWWQNNKYGIVASSPATSKPMWLFYLWHVLKDKCAIIILTLTITQQSTQDIMSSISPADLQHTINNMFTICNTCIWAEENHFQHLL